MPTSPPPVDEELRRRIGRAWRELRRGAAAVKVKDVFYGVGDDGMDMALADALALLCQFGPMRMGELADRLRVTPASTTRAVSCLTDKGYAARVKATDDQRSVMVSATLEGQEKHHEIAHRVQLGIQEILSEFDTHEQEQLADLLERFADSIDRFVSEQSRQPTP